MTTINESEFARICAQIRADQEQIHRFNPNVPRDEALLWMLLACLISYLSLSEQETPCFPGAPDAETYRAAILHTINARAEPKFDARVYLAEMLAA